MSWPMRPWKFISLYLILVVGSFLLQGYPWKFAIFASLICILAAFALHLTWVFRGLNTLSNSTHGVSHGGANWMGTARRSLVYSAVLVAIVLVIHILPGPSVDAKWYNLFNFATAFIVLFAFLFLLRIFWIAAVALCDSEAQTKAPPHTVVGTFLLYWYLVLGAPFLYKRLVKLRDQKI